MPLKIYNSLTNKKEVFKPLKKGKVGIYVCGVTVYDNCHLGHARGAFIFDFIRKYLQYKGYKVTYVRNITDIDDKIIEKARKMVEEDKKNGIIISLNEAVKETTKEYTAAYYHDMESLEIDRADIEPKATDHIQDMIKIIEGLSKKGFAYNKKGDVYYEVKKFKEYGKLSNQNLEELQAGARKGVKEDKNNPMDFALWKKAKEDEPKWPSPFSEGRPGWHIECSVMSTKYLGETFDIHGGGRDLIFPHHENEIAQSESYTSKPFANYWMHNGLLTIEGQKMAKSLGNFISIAEITKKYHPEVLKIFFLSSHYASPIDFSYKKMEEARISREKFYILFNRIDEIIKNENVPNNTESHKTNKITKDKLKKYFKDLEELRGDFIKAMDDNFNTSRALAALFEMTNLANKLVTDKDLKILDKIMFLKSVKYTFFELGHILGLFKKDKEESKGKEMNLLKKVMEIIIRVRKEVRQDKKFELADKIRKELKEAGIILEDRKDNTSWRIK